MTDDEHDDEDEPTPEELADDLFESNYEERREENLSQAELEDCEQIRKAGDLFQASEFETPADAIDLVSEGLGVDEEEAKWLLSVYTRIFTELSGHASGRADTAGRKYFSGRSIEEISEDNDRTLNETREDVRAFVGAYVRDHEVDNVDLNQPIPNNPYEPYRELFDKLPDIPSLIGSLDMPDFGSILPVIRPTFNIPIEPILEGLTPKFDDFDEILTPTFQIFQSADLQFEDQFIEAISEEVESPPDNWEAYSVLDEIDEEAKEDIQEETEERDNFEEEGTEAVSRLGNVDRETARELYLGFWNSARAGAAALGSQISDEKIAVIAAVTTILFIFTGNIPAAMGFLFIVLNKVAKISDAEEDPN